MKLKWYTVALTFGFLAGSPTALAQDDSNADAGAAYTELVKDSRAVIIRVPVDGEGEVATAAQMRLLPNYAPGISHDSDVVAAFDTALDVSEVPELSADSNTSDSSTWGWFGYRPYRRSYYNYYSYRPSYYYGGSYYNYGYGGYYNGYSPYGGGYNYYYYY